MSKQGTLYLFCGKMGAGKSTYSKKVSEQVCGILISEDEWLAAHFPGQIATFEDYVKYANMIKPFIKQHVQHLLKTGVNVVLDFPANTKKQRLWLMSISAELLCQHQLYYLNVDDHTCLAQIKKRREEQPERAQFDTDAVFHQVTRFFEPPGEDEQLNLIVC